MTERSKVILDMQDTVDNMLEQIEEHFHNDPAFRSIRRVATEMKQELEDVIELYEDQ